MDQFGAELRLGLVDVRTHDDPQDNAQIRVKAAMEATDFFTDPDFIDLADFARMVRDEAGIPLAYKSQAPNVLNALTPGGGAVIREAHGPAHSRVQGLSIYYPHDLLLPAGSEFDNPSPADHLYSRDPEILLPRLRLVNHAMRDEPRFRFPADTRWDEFLHRYYKPVADACVRLGELCLPHMIVPEGTVVILSGHGSSDSDGPQLDDVPFMWFWDLAPTLDNPAPLPNYQQGLAIISCTEEDCDRDELDDPDDDMDAEGELVPFRCLAPGTFSFRLIVWDEHHGFDRQHREDLAHNQGRHWLHFNVDDAAATLTCVLEIPEKQSHPEAVVPGQVFRYILTLPAARALAEPAEAWIMDQLPPQVAFAGNLPCTSGLCALEDTNTVTWRGLLGPGQAVVVEFDVALLDLPELPPVVVNRAAAFDGLELHELEAVTVALRPVQEAEAHGDP